MGSSTSWGSFGLVFALAHLGSAHAAASLHDCDEQQTGKITLAYLTAVPYLDAAKKELTDIRNGGDRSHFEAWFGHVEDESQDQERVNYVDSIIDATYQAAIGNAGYYCGPTLGCQGGPRIRAWTEHGSAVNNSFGVYVCPSFYTEDTEYQAGILVHEFSHLFGTEDFFADEEPSEAELNQNEKQAYVDAAHRLAVNTPEEAVYVAYNFGFFVMDR